MKQTVLILIIGFLLVACTPAQETELTGEPSKLPVIGPAPELTNSTWINTDQTLRLADLSGQVVLLDMWTFG